MILKVLESDMTSPYRGFKFEVGKEYVCQNFDPDHDHDCSRGFYATEIEGLPYSFRPGRRVFEAEVGGGNVNIDIYKRRWGEMTLVREVPKREIKALAKAYEPICGYKLSEVLFPIKPLMGRPQQPTDADIALLIKWAGVWDCVWVSVWTSVRDSAETSVWNCVRVSVETSVWNCVWASAWASVWASAWDSAWASVGAYIGSLFPGINQWEYIDHAPGVYPYQSGADLWRRGFVPIYDGKKWMLLSGKPAKIVWEEK